MTEIERLNDALKAAFIKIGIFKKADMANYLGYKSPYFSGIINGKEKLNDTFLQLISDKLNINSDWILRGEGSMLREDGVTQSASGDNNTQVAGNGNNVRSGADLKGIIDKCMDELAQQRRLTEKSQEQIDRLLSIIEKQSK